MERNGRGSDAKGARTTGSECTGYNKGAQAMENLTIYPSVWRQSPSDGACMTPGCQYSIGKATINYNLHNAISPDVPVTRDGMLQRLEGSLSTA